MISIAKINNKMMSQKINTIFKPVQLFVTGLLFLTTIAYGIVNEEDNQRTTIYISVTGDDQDNGSYSDPFATLERAQKEVRSLLATRSKDTIFVYLREGVYM